MSNSWNQLSEAEQREVAARLHALEQSNWRPFWCRDTACDGMPHWLETPDPVSGNLENTFVSSTATQGPNGEPVSPVLWETPAGDLYDPIFERCSPADDDTEFGRAVLDPQWAHNHARTDQRLPPWLKPWVRMIMSGRGSGKTTTGAEFVTLSARKGLDGAILGRRGTELVNTHVKTIIERAHPDFMPVHYASKDILVWPNGATTYLFSAEKPENIRSVNLSYAWVDEAAFMDDIKTAWMNLKLATRIEKPGNPIHILITTTPTGTPWVMKMEDDPDVQVVRVSTYANRANLSPDYLAALEKEYEGTRMGRQELHGEVLRDVEGALWNDDLFKHLRVDAVAFQDLVASMDDTVLAVDPAGSKGARSDATGIIGVGAQHTDSDGAPLPQGTEFYVLCDATLKGTPTEWAAQVFAAARLIDAKRIVVEKNFGGDMVVQVLKDYAKQNPKRASDRHGDEYRIITSRAVKSKETRAEPVVGRYEQRRVTHASSPTKFGDLSSLEREQVTWVPKSRGGRLPSPNRIDALVWAVRELDKALKFPSSAAAAKTVQKALRDRPHKTLGRTPVSGNRSTRPGVSGPVLLNHLGQVIPEIPTGRKDKPQGSV